MRKSKLCIFIAAVVIICSISAQAQNIPHDVGINYVSVDGRDVSFTLKKGNGEYADELLGSTGYLVEYNEDGSINGIEQSRCEAMTSKEFTFSLPQPQTNNYKYMFWDKNMKPYSSALTDLQTEPYLYGPSRSESISDIESSPAIPDVLAWFGASWDDAVITEHVSSNVEKQHYFSAKIKLKRFDLTEGTLLDDFVALIDKYGFKLEKTSDEVSNHYLNKYATFMEDPPYYGCYEQILTFTYTGDSTDDLCYYNYNDGTHFSVSYENNYSSGEKYKYTQIEVYWAKGLTVVDTGDRREGGSKVKSDWVGSTDYVDFEPTEIVFKEIGTEEIPDNIRGVTKNETVTDGGTYDMEEYDELVMLNPFKAFGDYYAYSWYTVSGSDLVILERDEMFCHVYAKGGTGTVTIQTNFDCVTGDAWSGYQNYSYTYTFTVNISEYTGTSVDDGKSWVTCTGCGGVGKTVINGTVSTCPLCSGAGIILR